MVPIVTESARVRADTARADRGNHNDLYHLYAAVHTTTRPKGEAMSTHTPITVTPYLTPDRDQDPMLVYRISGDLQERFDSIPCDDHEESKIEAAHEENRALARHIERAVNTHAQLLEALKLVNAEYNVHFDITDADDPGNDTHEQVRSAIAQAEGKD